MLLGELHAIGFYHAIRVHDVIVTQADAVTALALIDLDLKGQQPILAQYDHAQCMSSLVQTAYMFIRCRHTLRSSAELRQFFRGYRNGLRIRGQIPPQLCLRRLFNAVDSKLAEHSRDSKLATAVPKMPHTLAEILLRGGDAFER